MEYSQLESLAPVHCRVGSLEMGFRERRCRHSVHCRVGSLESKLFIAALFDTVHCRVGSLENTVDFRCGAAHVHCRVGSLEIGSLCSSTACLVHCRVGSLENYPHGLADMGTVHCRVGSLEDTRGLPLGRPISRPASGKPIVYHCQLTSRDVTTSARITCSVAAGARVIVRIPVARYRFPLHLSEVG